MRFLYHKTVYHYLKNKSGLTHLSFESFVESAGDHSPRIRLDGDDGPKTVSKRPAHQVSSAAALKKDNSLSCNMVRLVEFARSIQCLQTWETTAHLPDRKWVLRYWRDTIAHSCTVYENVWDQPLSSSSGSYNPSMFSGSTWLISSTLRSWICGNDDHVFLFCLKHISAQKTEMLVLKYFTPMCILPMMKLLDDQYSA